MASKLWEGCYSRLLDSNGEPASGALLYFYASGTSTPLTVYSDSSLAVPHASPVVCSAAGMPPKIYMGYADFRVVATDASGAAIYDIDGIENAAPPASGGGGGVVVTADQLPQTGTLEPSLNAGTRAGWVRANGKTIGSATSPGTERQNADCEALFTLLWNTFPDSVCPVGGGRGVSAAADWAAAKDIATPDARGRSLIGVDAMGNTAANRIQTTTTITTTAGSATATVGSASNLAIGMYAIASTLPAGVTIAGISGTTVTLSTGTGVTAGTATAVRFSFFADAEAVGSSAGAMLKTLSLSELPAHDHTGSVSVTGTASVTGYVTGGSVNFSDIYTNATGTIGTAAGGGTAISALGTTTAGNTIVFPSGSLSVFGSGPVSASGSFTTATRGSGLPFSVLPPSMTVTVYIKL